MTADTAQVWLVDARLPEHTVAALHAVLDDDERARAQGYRHADNRRRFVVAHGAVRCVLGELLGVPAAELHWRRGEHGKPELTGRWAGTPVNLSHSGELSLVCVATRATGVDVQRIDADLDAVALATRFFPPEEAGYVASSRTAGTRADRFATLWTRKEAVVKAAGGRLAQGLRLGVRQPVVVIGDRAYRLAGVPVPHGYRAAVALYGEDGYRITVRSWTWRAPR
jgi:4'-phosphopantetheinyl transferase